MSGLTSRRAGSSIQQNINITHSDMNEPKEGFRMLDYRFHFAQLVAEDRLRQRRQQVPQPVRAARRIFRLGQATPQRRPAR